MVKSSEKKRKSKKAKKSKEELDPLYISSLPKESPNIITEIIKIKEGRRPSPAVKKIPPKKIPFNWDKIECDKNGEPIISFKPSPDEREKMIEILNLTMRKPIKKSLVKKLGKEFGRAYQRYRRALERADGKRGHWLLGGNSIKQAERGGELCIRKGLTPFQVLKYWHVHIKDLFDGSMKIPAIAFITSEQAMETIACSNLEEEEEKTNFGNSFSSINQLDKNIRVILQDGGFDVSELKDDYLLQVQHAAVAKQNGMNFFVSGKMKKMIKHLNKKYYKAKK